MALTGRQRGHEKWSSPGGMRRACPVHDKFPTQLAVSPTERVGLTRRASIDSANASIGNGKNDGFGSSSLSHRDCLSETVKEVRTIG